MTHADVYDEIAFRYLLAVERKRVERSGCPAILLLLELKKVEGDRRMSRAIAETLFSSLCGCLRETDFIGWYGTDRIVGAVLTQVCKTSASRNLGAMREKISRVLRERLPQHTAARLDVKVFWLRSEFEA
jgi:hypothetical protein